MLAFAVASIAGDRAARARDEPPAVLVSRQLLENAHLAVGDVVTLSADPKATAGRPFQIVGVYEPTPDPMRFNVERLEMRMHLDDVLAFTADEPDRVADDTVSTVNLRLNKAAEAESIASDIAARNPLLVATPTSRLSEAATFIVIDRFHVAIAAVTVVGSAAFLLALMVIRAEERRETIGILRLIGVSTRSIVSAVVVEGLMVAIAGAIFGIALAAIAQYGVNRYFQARYDTALVFVRVTPSIALRSVAVAMPVGVVAGAVASWTVLRRRASALVRR